MFIPTKCREALLKCLNEVYPDTSEIKSLAFSTQELRGKHCVACQGHLKGYYVTLRGIVRTGIVSVKQGLCRPNR